MFFHDPILKRDDIPLIKPLSEISSIGDYSELVRKNKILDTQPIRDLTLWINVKIYKHFSVSLFHLFNIFITFCLQLAFFRLVTLLGVSKRIAIAMTVLLAFHPIFVVSNGWISARKHSLSILFCMLMIIQVLKQQRISMKGVVYYFLSVFSHPITLTIPGWLLLLRYLGKIKKLGTNFYLLGFISVLGFSANYIKYYLLGEGNLAAVRNRPFFDIISTAVLSFGRSFYLIFTPSHLSTIYHESNIRNLIGIVIFAFVIMFYRKYGSKKDIFIWFSLLLFVNLTYLQYFINDSYLFLPLISQFVLLSLIVQKNYKKILSYFYPLALFFFGFVTYNSTPMWYSDFNLWQTSYLNERSPWTQIIYGMQLFKEDQLLAIDFIDTALNDIDLREKQNMIPFLFYVISGADKISYERRLALINKARVPTSSPVHMFWARVLLDGPKEHREKGIETIIEGMNDQVVRDSIGYSDFIVRLNEYCSIKDEIHFKTCKRIKSQVKE